MWKVLLIVCPLLIGIIVSLFIFKFFAWIIVPSYLTGVISTLWIQSIFKKKPSKKEKV